MNTSEIFSAQMALKELIVAEIASFEEAYPEVTRVTLSPEYTPEGETLKVTIILENEGESITRRV